MLAMAVPMCAQDTHWKTNVDAGEQLLKEHRYIEADNDFQEALTEANQLGYKDQRLALALYDMGWTYAAEKRYSEAEAPLKRSLDIRQNLLGRDHLEVAQSSYMLGMVYVAEEKFEEAEPLLSESLSIKEKILGPEHPDVAENLYILSMDLLGQGKFQEAEPLLDRSLTITEKVLGPEDPKVAKILESLAIVQRNTDRAVESQATEARAKAIQARETSPPSAGPSAENQTADTLTVAQQPTLGDLARQATALKEQRARQEKSIDIYEGTLTIRVTPKVADTEDTLITHMEVIVGNSSSRDYRYAFTVSCGEWSKNISDNIKGSSEGAFQKVILVDAPSPCDWSTASLVDVMEAEGLDGPEPKPSKMPGVDDAELARQSAVQKQRIVETSSPADSVSAAQARVNKVCNYGLSMTPGEITNTMADCDQAENDLEGAMTAQGESQSRASAQGGGESENAADYVISLTGTAGLPVTGNCNFAGKYESYDDILPAEHVVPAGRGVLCSFVKKYVEGTLKMQIIQNGVVRNEGETEVSYGDVTLDVDW
jgi:tetratricopeptide (TPR) repeat protein